LSLEKKHDKVVRHVFFQSLNKKSLTKKSNKRYPIKFVPNNTSNIFTLTQSDILSLTLKGEIASNPAIKTNDKREFYDKEQTYLENYDRFISFVGGGGTAVPLA